MPSALVHLQVFAHDVAFEACLNDIPIVSLPVPLDGFDQQIPVNQFLIPRYNRLNLWVGIKGKPTESGKLYLRIAGSPWNCDSSGSYKITVNVTTP